MSTTRDPEGVSLGVGERLAEEPGWECPECQWHWPEPLTTPPVGSTCDECGELLVLVPPDDRLASLEPVPPDLVDLLREARGWIASEGHAAGCSGAFPPHRCKCHLAEFLAQIDAALAPPDSVTQPRDYTKRDETGHYPGCPAWVVEGAECECERDGLEPSPETADEESG